MHTHLFRVVVRLLRQRYCDRPEGKLLLGVRCGRACLDGAAGNGLIMNFQINDLPVVRITLPLFMCFVWQHLSWFLGMIQISFVAVLGASDALSPGALKWALILSGLFTAITGYVKSNPPPDIATTRPLSSSSPYEYQTK
jgi:hypothetical protein